MANRLDSSTGDNNLAFNERDRDLSSASIMASWGQENWKFAVTLTSESRRSGGKSDDGHVTSRIVEGGLKPSRGFLIWGKAQKWESMTLHEACLCAYTSEGLVSEVTVR